MSKLQSVSKAEYLITLTYNGETIQARCETEAMARYIVSLLYQPNPAGIEQITIGRVRSMEFLEKVLQVGREDLA